MAEKQAEKILGTLGYVVKTSEQAWPRPVRSEKKTHAIKLVAAVSLFHFTLYVIADIRKTQFFTLF